MLRKNLVKIAIFNVIGLALFFSAYLTTYQGFWFEIDKSIFYYFNHLVGSNAIFMYFVAFVNKRGFDTVAFIFMIIIYYSYYRKANVEGKRWLFCIGLAMLISAGIIKQCDNMMAWDRMSPTLYFEQLNHDVNFVSKLSGWSTKDSSSTSFPGDHGMLLLIFCAHMWRYLGTKAFVKGIVVFVIFSLPRIMSGAHWFTDIAVGSVSFVLVVQSWLLLTPASDIFVGWLESKLPLKWFMKKRK